MSAIKGKRKLQKESEEDIFKGDETENYLLPLDKNEDDDESDSDYEGLTDEEESEGEGEESDESGGEEEGEETDTDEEENTSSEDEGNQTGDDIKSDKDETDDIDTETPGPSKNKSVENRENDKEAYNEYEEDSSDEEDLRNTIGNVPIKWYDEYSHIGYDLDGEKILKPKKGDTLDMFLSRLENPDHGRTVLDKQTGQDVRLSDQDLDILKRVMGYKVPDSSYDYYAPWQDLYSHEVMDMPLSGNPDSKKSFLPAMNEQKEISRLVRAIKNGTLKYRKPERKYQFNYDVWREDDPELEKLKSRIGNPLPAPKEPKPGHGESYRPPPEYIFTDKEKYGWERRMKKYKENPEFQLRDYTFCPTAFEGVRNIPAFKDFIKERFNRCLDLYLAPRKRIFRCIAKSKDLLPDLPRPRDLRPFPTLQGQMFKGHRSIVRTISVHPLGRYLASGSDDRTVKIWEISTGRCVKSFDVEGAVKCVSWNPHKDLFLLAVVFENTLVLLNPESYLVDKIVVQKTNSAFQQEPDQGDYIVPDRVAAAVTWRKATPEEWSKGYRCVMTFFKELKMMVWHRQGDYFATLIPEGQHRSVLMHQLSRWRSQMPFNKTKGRVQTISFHPKLPYLYVCTETHIRVYNLQKQDLLKKVKSNARHISCMAVHPSGEHFIIGDFHKKVIWFEMEYTKRPLILRYHHDSIRSVAFHRKYPLFASASDDGRIIIGHGMVYKDYLKDPLLVPVKDLFGHKRFDDFIILDLAWHPYQPFLFSAGADSTIRMWH